MVYSKKAQGALEFLMTYGWAFLVILIMIGALAYFGVLNPTKFLPERCTFGAQMACKDHKLALLEGTVTLRLQNNFGSSIAIIGASTTATSPDGFACGTPPAITDIDLATTYTPDAESNTLIPEGETFVITFSGCNFATAGGSAGEKFKADIAVNYYDPRSGSGFAHSTQGEVFATIEP